MTTMTGSEWLLYRAFATVEVNCSKACWQKHVRTGYEVSHAYHPDHMSRDERLGSDGNRHRDLREQLDPFWFAVLEIRYGDNPEKIRQALKSSLVHPALVEMPVSLVFLIAAAPLFHQVPRSMATQVLSSVSP